MERVIANFNFMNRFFLLIGLVTGSVVGHFFAWYVILGVLLASFLSATYLTYRETQLVKRYEEAVRPSKSHLR